MLYKKNVTSYKHLALWVLADTTDVAEMSSTNRIIY